MNFSISEILLVLLIALLVVKPEQLPDVARTLGRLMRSVRGIYSKVKEEMNGFIDDDKPVTDNTNRKNDK